METTQATCPLCSSPLVAESYPYRPFCSKRCKLVDLSKWLGEEYRIAGPPAGDGGVEHGYDEDELL